MSEVIHMKDGEVMRCEVIYRIVVHLKDDLELTRAQAVKLRNQLSALLAARAMPVPIKKSRRSPR